MKLGAYLKNKREQSGITLKEMQEKSGLRKDIIRTIEAGDLKALPEYDIDETEMKRKQRKRCR